MKLPLLTFSLIVLYWTCIICAKEEVNSRGHTINSDKYTSNYQNTKEGSSSKNKIKQMGLLISLTTQVSNFLKYEFGVASKEIGCSKVEGLSVGLIINSFSNPQQIIQTVACYIVNKISNIDLTFVLTQLMALIGYIWMVITKIFLPSLQETLIKLPPENLPPSLKYIISEFLLFYKVLQVLQIVE